MAERLAVIIVSYNSEDVLAECIRALDQAVAVAAPLLEDTYDLIVVDNASMMCPTIQPNPDRRTQIFEMNANLGFSRGVNVGLRASESADLVLLLNPDARLDPDALRAMIRDLRASGASVAGPILVAKGRPHGMSERAFHSCPREAARQFAPALVQRRPYSRRAEATGWARSVTGACLLADGRFLQAMGGLDETVAMYLEDIELCWQAHRHGGGVRLVSDARCAHELGGSSGTTNFKTSQTLHVTLLAARVEFVRRRRGEMAARAMRTVMALGAVIRLGVSLLKRDSTSVAKHRHVLQWAVRSGEPPPWPMIGAAESVTPVRTLML